MLGCTPTLMFAIDLVIRSPGLLLRSASRIFAEVLS
jgi:hypothetical protein